MYTSRYFFSYVLASYFQLCGDFNPQPKKKAFSQACQIKLIDEIWDMYRWRLIHHLSFSYHGVFLVFW